MNVHQPEGESPSAKNASWRVWVERVGKLVHEA